MLGSRGDSEVSLLLSHLQPQHPAQPPQPRLAQEYPIPCLPHPGDPACTNQHPEHPACTNQNPGHPSFTNQDGRSPASCTNGQAGTEARTPAPSTWLDVFIPPARDSVPSRKGHHNAGRTGMLGWSSHGEPSAPLCCPMAAVLANAALSFPLGISIAHHVQ